MRTSPSHGEEMSVSVTFNPCLRVILIPSRGEFKHAGLYGELWWAHQDFLSFQASANSEIRMLASYEGIGAKMARQKLYQPGNESIDLDEFRAFAGETSGDDRSNRTSDVSSSSCGSTPSSSPYSSAIDLPALAVNNKCPPTPKSAAWRPTGYQKPPIACSTGGGGGGGGAVAAAFGKGSSSISAVLSSSSISSSPPSTFVGIMAAAPSSLSSALDSTSTSSAFRNRPEEGSSSSSSSSRQCGNSIGNNKAAIQHEEKGDDEDFFGHYEISEETEPGGEEEEEGEEDSDAERFRSLSKSSNNSERDDVVGEGEVAEDDADPANLRHRRSKWGDEIECSGLHKVNSLDCVKSALRVPLPETLDDDAASDCSGSPAKWSWNGKKKSGKERRPNSSSSNSRGARALPPLGGEDGFWRLCVLMEKPNGLDGERKSRFSNRSFSGQRSDVLGGMGLWSLVGWVGAFAVVAYLVLDGSASAPAKL